MAVREKIESHYFKYLNHHTDIAEICFKVVVSIFIRSTCPLTQDYFNIFSRLTERIVKERLLRKYLHGYLDFYRQMFFSYVSIRK